METKEKLSTTKNENLNFRPVGKNNKRLVKEAMRGNPEAVNKVIGLYYKDILYFAAKKVGIQEAEDIAQQAISKIVDKLETLRDPSKAKSWMMKIVHDSCVDHMRRGNLENKLFASMDSTTIENIEIEESADEFLPEEAIENAEMRAQIIQVIDTLPENYGDALRLFYLDDLNYEEISQVLGITNRKVKNDLYHARIIFRKRFEESTGVQTRLAVASAAAVPVLTQVLQADCDQIITPAAIDRVAAFTDGVVEAKFGASAAASSASAGKIATSTTSAKVVAGSVALVAVVGITAALVFGSATEAPGDAPIAQPETTAPAPSPSEAPIETLADMIGPEKASTLESFVQSGTDETTWQAFLADIGADLHNNSYEYDYTYAVYVLEKQDKQLMLAERKGTQSTQVQVIYQFGLIQELPRMAKVALMFT